MLPRFPVEGEKDKKIYDFPSVQHSTATVEPYKAIPGQSCAKVFEELGVGSHNLRGNFNQALTL